MAILALLVALGAVAFAGWVLLWTRGRFEGFDTAVREPYNDTAVLAALDVLDDRLGGLRDDQQTLAEKINDQNLAIAEGIERVDRAERRVRSAVGRARKRMADLGYADDALEAEAESLRTVDAPVGDYEGMQPVSEAVEDRDLSAFPGEW